MTRVALGGTFEVIHKGHRALLDRAFALGGEVLIGLTSDDLANRTRSRRVAAYQEREAALRAHLERTYPGRDFEVTRIDDEFGPAVTRGDLEVLVVSENTRATALRLNEERRRRGMGPLTLVVIPHVLADDGRPISSTRVLAGECDVDGRTVSS